MAPRTAPAGPAPRPDDSFEASETTGGLTWGKRVALAGLGMVALAGPAFAGAGPVGAAAATAAPPAVSRVVEKPAAPTRRPLVIPKEFHLPTPGTVEGTALDLSLPPSGDPPPAPLPERKPAPATAADTSKVGWRIEGALVNDSLRDPFGVVPKRYLEPGTDHGDDDGWTAEPRLDVIRTEGDQQSVTSGRLQMVTERGSWDPYPGYGGLRTDIIEFAHQHNFREQLDSRTNMVYGVGLGIQSVGNHGGRSLQEWVHENGYRGGRVGAEQGLQTVYSTEGATWAPMVTGGVGIQYRLDEQGDWNLKTSLEAGLPVGPGLANLRSTAGVEYQATDRLSLGAGLGVQANWAQGEARDALRFIDTDGVRPVGYVEAEYRLFDNVSAFGRIDHGGVRDEPVYRIGITIHFGGGKREKAWLDPLYK